MYYLLIDILLADEHTEELLVIHEKEIKHLKEERRMKAPLLVGIKKYFEICEEEKELAAAASDQSRLLGRGKRDPGRLLREEKMRKRVNKEKPRVRRNSWLLTRTFRLICLMYCDSSNKISWHLFPLGKRKLAGRSWFTERRYCVS
jgi:hypothetical protein